MTRDEVGVMVGPESRVQDASGGSSLLLQLRTDRRLGHEWDDWDGRPLPNGGVFDEREGVFFRVAVLAILSSAAVGAVGVWLVSPRVGAVLPVAPLWLGGAVIGLTFLALVWVGVLWLIVRTGRALLPERLAERGLLPWLLPGLEWAGRVIGLSRDRVGNAALRVYNRVAAARSAKVLAPEEVLILIPRCLGKEAMQTALAISRRYGVPLFVAARGRHARQMIAARRPRGIVAVACERDLISGVHDVARSLPVLGTTLRLGDGPCRNTEFSATELEGQIRGMLGLGVTAPEVR